ncbi:hypothetical protein vseg_000537 [Gypsophila vaccaria]
MENEREIGGNTPSQPPATSSSQPPSQIQPPASSSSQLSLSVSLLKPESPRGRPLSNGDNIDATLKRKKQCHCKHSRCLKLYCECFASGVYCDGCNCNNCFNNVENESARREAVEATLERNSKAFKPKIASRPHGTKDIVEEAGELIVVKHNKGCHCKKSGCLKKYCECFQAKVLCSGNCKCIDCKNFEGSEERLALLYGDLPNNLTHVQQAANAAITGAVGSSGYTFMSVPRKRKDVEHFFGPPLNNLSVIRGGQFQQANHIKPSGPYAVSSTSAARAANSISPTAPKLKYRSLLANIIQPQDVKELCSVLVVLSEEAAKTLAESRNSNEKIAEDGVDTSTKSSSQDRLQCRNESDHEAEPCDGVGGNETDKIGTDDSNLDGNDILQSRPMSPLTLALRCDEQDTVFPKSGSSDGLTNDVHTSPQMAEQSTPETEEYAKQERIVLTKFRDCLNRLITYGELKETKCLSLARSAAVSYQGIGNGIGKTRTDRFDQRECNGAVKPVTPATAPIRTPAMVAAAVTAVPTKNVIPRNPLQLNRTI